MPGIADTWAVERTTMSLPNSATTSEAASGLAHDEPTTPQPRGFILMFLLSWFGINLAIGTISSVSIPKAFVFLDDATKEFNLSIVAALGGLLVILVTPLAGRLSDRTRSKLGIRRPWILWGAVIGFCGAVVLGFATGLWSILAGFIILKIGLGSANAATHALLAEQIPVRIRARVTGVVSASTGIAFILGAGVVALLPNDAQWSWFIIPGAIGSLFCGLLYFRMNDIVRTEPREPLQLRDIASTFWVNPRTAPDFFWAWLCRLLVLTSVSFVSIYLLYFIIDYLGVSKEEATAVQATGMAIFALLAVVTAVLFGWISDKLGKRKVIIWISCAISAAGMIMGMLSTSVPMFICALAIVGAAQGAFLSVDLALLTQVLPNAKDAGKDLGIVALSAQLPQFIVPVIALPILTLGGGQNYTALYIVAIIFGVLGAIAVLPVKSVK